MPSPINSIATSDGLLPIPLLDGAGRDMYDVRCSIIDPYKHSVRLYSETIVLYTMAYSVLIYVTNHKF